MIKQTPPAEVHITTHVVKQLLLEQYPDLADLPLMAMGEGWDNVMYRLGEHLIIRLPRRQIAAQLMINEQKWLSYFAPKLPLAIPAPIRKGQPTHFYPWHWSVIPFVEGQTANIDVPHLNQSIVFAKFLKTLHQVAPLDAPINSYRGISIKVRAKDVEPRLLSLKHKTNLITPTLKKIWSRALKAPEAEDNLWVHGDLHPKNILVNNGKIVSVIDWGDLTSGDVASDLASIWMLFDTFSKRKAFILHYQPTPDLLARAKGWAIFYGTILLDIGLADDEEFATIGRQTLERLIEDETR